jgi:hypothetical protein
MKRTAVDGGQIGQSSHLVAVPILECIYLFLLKLKLSCSVMLLILVGSFVSVFDAELIRARRTLYVETYLAVGLLPLTRSQ